MNFPVLTPHISSLSHGHSLDKNQRPRGQREIGPSPDSLLVYSWTFTFYSRINLLNFTVTCCFDLN